MEKLENIDDVKKDLLDVRNLYEILISLKVADTYSNKLQFKTSKLEEKFLSEINHLQEKSFEIYNYITQDKFLWKKNILKEYKFHKNELNKIIDIKNELLMLSNKKNEIDSGSNLLPKIKYTDLLKTYDFNLIYNICLTIVDSNPDLVQWLIINNTKLNLIEEYVIKKKHDRINSQSHLLRTIKDQLRYLIFIFYCIEEKIEYREQLFFNID